MTIIANIIHLGRPGQRITGFYQLCNDLNEEEGHIAGTPALPDALQLPCACDHVRQPDQASQQLASQDTAHYHIDDVQGVMMQDPAGGILHQH